MLCSEARVDSSALRRGQLQRQDMTNLTYAAAALSKAPILTYDTPAPSLREVRALASRRLLGGARQAARAGREQDIREIARGLKSLAKVLDCPVLALSQLNR